MSMIAKVVRGAFLILLIAIAGADWPMLGRDQTRNPVSLEKGSPIFWQPERRDDKGIRIQPARNIRWVGQLGSHTYGDPVVANGLVWVGTNTSWRAQPRENDASVLTCFRESDGQLLYRYISPRLSQGMIHDWPSSSLACSPFIEGDRLWFTTNRCETVCLRIRRTPEGGLDVPVVWSVDMMKELGVSPRGTPMAIAHFCSIAGYQDYIYVITGHGVNQDFSKVTKPDAPSLVCFHKDTGKVVWKDNSPGENILDGQWASPLVMEINGRAQVIAPQGDGWLRSFDAKTGNLIWKFDMNRKEASWALSRSMSRNNILATPVLYENRIYIANGHHPAHGTGPGRLCCIDPTKEGDISTELAVDASGKPLAHRRVQAVDRKKGEKAIPNPRSGLVWEFTKQGNTDVDQMHCSVSSVAIHKGLVIAADSEGYIHCLDARTGAKHWTYDAKAGLFGHPLIVDDRIYVANEDGDVQIFGLSADPARALRKVAGAHEPLATIEMGVSIHAAPIFANGVLYIATHDHLYAIRDEPGGEKSPRDIGGYWPQYRGPDRSNASRESNLLSHWPPEGPPLVWKAQGIGEGMASVAVADGRIFTLGSQPDSEFAVALDEKDGARIWSTYLGPGLRQMPLMRWLNQRTPTVDRDRVYFVTLQGELHCLRAADGKRLWQKSYVDDFKATMPTFGFCDYPLVDADRLICTPGSPGAALVALDKRTGEVVWKSAVTGVTHASYGATVLTEVEGIRQYVAALPSGLVGIAATDGRLLWRQDKGDKRVLYSYTPIVDHNFILSANGYSPGVGLLQLLRAQQGMQAREVYQVPLSLNLIGESSVLANDRLYVIRTPDWLVCLEKRTGKTLWEAPRGAGAGRPSLTFADGLLYVRYANGIMNLVEDRPQGYQEKGSFKIPDHVESMGATLPVIAGSRLYVRDNQTLLSYDIRADALERQRPAPRLVNLKPPVLPKETDSPSRQPRTGKNRAPDAIYVPTPQDVVDKMLELAKADKKDLVIDLGSGDGRIVLTAAQKYGAKAIGYEIDPALVKLSREAIQKQQLQDRVRIEHEDIFTLDLGQADVVTVYLPSHLLTRLLPQLEKLKPGTRIVSHYFEIPGIKPDAVTTILSNEDGNQHKLYLWKCPLGRGK